LLLQQQLVFTGHHISGLHAYLTNNKQHLQLFLKIKPNQSLIEVQIMTLAEHGVRKEPTTHLLLFYGKLKQALLDK